jgi:hypothetical protein
VISWGYTLGMAAEFDLQGTRDPGPFLAAPEGLAFMRELGLDAMRDYNHALVWRAATEFTRAWGTNVPAPESMFGSMVTVLLPEAYGTRPEDAGALKNRLLFEHRIETQIGTIDGRLSLRLAAQVYNEWSDFEKLLAAIGKKYRVSRAGERVARSLARSCAPKKNFARPLTTFRSHRSAGRHLRCVAARSAHTCDGSRLCAPFFARSCRGARFAL